MSCQRDQSSQMEGGFNNGVRMRNMQTTQLCGKKTQIDNKQDLEMAYKVVPRVEGISEGVGKATGRVVGVPPGGNL